MRLFIHRFFMLLPVVVIISLISSFIALETNNAIAHAIPLVLGFLTITGLGIGYFVLEYGWMFEKEEKTTINESENNTRD